MLGFVWQIGKIGFLRWQYHLFSLISPDANYNIKQQQ